MNQNQGFGQSPPPYPPGNAYPGAGAPAYNQNYQAPGGYGPGPGAGGFNNAGPPAPGGFGFGPPGQGNFNNAVPSAPGGFGPAVAAPPPGGQWNTMASGPPDPAPSGGGDIGFHFTGQSLPGYIDSALEPIIQPPTNPYFDDDGGEGQKSGEALPLLPPPAAVTEEEVKGALELWAGKKCCYGPPTGISIGDIQMKSGFKYNLKSSTETRETVWEFEPYTGQKISGPTGGALPGPWAVEIHPNQSFVKEKKDVQIPGTASVRQCHACCGNGRTRCTHCSGNGGTNCTWCKGTGRSLSEVCSHCNGNVRTICTWCTGNGMEKCKTCQGRSQLFVYLKLIAKWDVLSDDFVSAASSIPNQYLTKRSKGVQVVNDKGRRVMPVTNFPDEAINTTSQNLIQKHTQAVMPNGAIREQAQSVEMIRIAEISYTWKEKTGTFHMFGTDNHIYFPDYPETCKCCCVIS